METTDFKKGPSADDPLVGRVFAGRYSIRRRLARGSMGAVYEAEQLPLGRLVAVKILDARPLDDKLSAANASARFLREASLLSKLTHPNTVRVYDYGVESNRPFLVMELVRGSTLRQLMSGTKLEPLRTLRIARQVCASLHEAHQAGLIHRDLKPANILVTQDPEGTDVVKVVDFGLVKEIEGSVEMTEPGLILGTPQFMAPEQIRAETLDQRCDVYAMGVLLFRALTGHYPLAQGDPSTVLMSHLKDAPKSFAEVDPTLTLPDPMEWTVRRCLAKARQDRFLDAWELRRALTVCEAAILDEGNGSVNLLTLVQGRVVVPSVARRLLRLDDRVLGVLVLLGLALTMCFGFGVGYLFMRMFVSV